MELSKELRNEKESVEADNKEFSEEQIKDLESKIESYELGSDAVEHNFSEEPIDLGKQISLETDIGKRSKLVMENLNNLTLIRRK